MSLSMSRALTIARREYKTTVRRKAFVFTLVFVPLYYALVSVLPAMMVGKSMAKRLAETHVVAVVDSSGALAQAPSELRSEFTPEQSPFAGKSGGPPMPRVFRANIRFYPDQAAAEADLRAGKVNQMLVVPPDFLATGQLRRYAREGSVLGNAQDRGLRVWLARALLAHGADSLRTERAIQPMTALRDYTLDHQDRWELKDDARDTLDIFLPLGVAMLLGMAIVIGGQYLLQGVSEEKESRILESLLCTVTPDDLMVGKLLGLGSAGMTLVVAWVGAALYFGGPIAAMLNARFTPPLLVLGALYFAFGYLFYASLMTAIGAIANNLREAQQIAYMFTFANFAPLIFLISVVDQPNGPLAVTLSLFPLSAASSMLMRLSTGATVPPWQIAVSFALLVGCALLALRIGARIFRTGLLMYGKTPNLPEIMRWAREA